MEQPDQDVEIPLTLRVSEQTRKILAQRAADSGTDLAGYVSLLAEQLSQSRLFLNQIDAEIAADNLFKQSGLTEDQLSDALEREKHELRAQRRARHAS
jgi:hypothetical protein